MKHNGIFTLLALPLSTSGLLLPLPSQTTPPSALRTAISPDLNLNLTYSNYPQNGTLLERSTGWSPAVALQDSSGVCPQWAYINCQSITSPNYCCAEGTYCAYGGEDNHIGCCADADTCSGTPPDVTTTVWVPSATATTWWTQSGTTVTELIGPVQTVTTTATEYVTGEPTTICSTLYAHGKDLPTTAAAACGLVLVLNAAPGRVAGWEAVALAVLEGVILVVGWLGLV